MKHKQQLTDNAMASLVAQGQAIQQRRKALKISAQNAAEAAAISRLTWLKIEAGNPGVAGGSYASALAVLGLTLGAPMVQNQQIQTTAVNIPDLIPVAEYPKLRQLAWHVHANACLTPDEAFGIYERNRRHSDTQQLGEKERNLVRALRRKFTGHDS